MIKTLSNESKFQTQNRQKVVTNQNCYSDSCDHITDHITDKIENFRNFFLRVQFEWGAFIPFQYTCSTCVSTGLTHVNITHKRL